MRIRREQIAIASDARHAHRPRCNLTRRSCIGLQDHWRKRPRLDSKAARDAGRSRSGRYEEARRALDGQERALGAFRTRAGVVLSAAAIVTSFLGGQALGATGFTTLSPGPAPKPQPIFPSRMNPGTRGTGPSGGK
jgi:hypothetical protein